MSLPDRLTTEELLTNSFVIVGSDKARHSRYNSQRHQCSQCGLWVKQGFRSNANNLIYCRRCSVHLP